MAWTPPELSVAVEEEHPTAEADPSGWAPPEFTEEAWAPPEIAAAEPPAPTSNPVVDFLKRLPASVASATAQIFEGGAYLQGEIVKRSNPYVLAAVAPQVGLPNLVVEKLFGKKRGTWEDTVRNFARDVSDISPEVYGVDPARDSTIPSQIAGGIGSVVPAIASGPAAPFTIAAMMGAQGVEDAEKHGATEEQQQLAFLGNAAVGAISEALLGVPALLRSAKAAKIPEAALGAFTRSAAGQAVKGFLREGSQEGIEQVLGNFVASTVAGYDPNRGTFDGFWQAVLLGGLVGAPVGAVVQTAQNYDNQEVPKQITASASTEALRSTLSDTDALKELPYAQGFIETELAEREKLVPRFQTATIAELEGMVTDPALLGLGPREVTMASEEIASRATTLAPTLEAAQGAAAANAPLSAQAAVEAALADLDGVPPIPAAPEPLIPGTPDPSAPVEEAPTTAVEEATPAAPVAPVAPPFVPPEIAAGEEQGVQGSGDQGTTVAPAPEEQTADEARAAFQNGQAANASTVLDYEIEVPENYTLVGDSYVPKGMAVEATPAAEEVVSPKPTRPRLVDMRREDVPIAVGAAAKHDTLGDVTIVGTKEVGPGVFHPLIRTSDGREFSPSWGTLRWEGPKEGAAPAAPAVVAEDEKKTPDPLHVRRDEERNRLVSKFNAPGWAPAVQVQQEFTTPDAGATNFGLRLSLPDGRAATITKSLPGEQEFGGVRFSFFDTTDGTTDAMFFPNVEAAVRYANGRGFSVDPAKAKGFDAAARHAAQVAEEANKRAALEKVAQLPDEAAFVAAVTNAPLADLPVLASLVSGDRKKLVGKEIVSRIDAATAPAETAAADVTLTPAQDKVLADNATGLLDQWLRVAEVRGIKDLDGTLAGRINDAIRYAASKFDPTKNNNFKGFASRTIGQRLNITPTAHEIATSLHATRLDAANDQTGRDFYEEFAVTQAAEDARATEDGVAAGSELRAARDADREEAQNFAFSQAVERAKAGDDVLKEAVYRTLKGTTAEVSKETLGIDPEKKFTKQSAAVTAARAEVETQLKADYDQHYADNRREALTNRERNPGQPTSGSEVAAPSSGGGAERSAVDDAGSGRPVARDERPGTGDQQSEVERVPRDEPAQLPAQGGGRSDGVPEAVRLDALESLNDALESGDLLPSEHAEFQTRLDAAATPEEVRAVLVEAGVLNPVLAARGAGEGKRVKNPRRYGSLTSKKTRTAEGDYDPQIPTVRVGRIDVDKRFETLTGEQKETVSRFVKALGERFGTAVRVLFADGGNKIAWADPTIRGLSTVSVDPTNLAEVALTIDDPKARTLWLKRLGFEEVGHLAGHLQVRQELERSLGRAASPEEFYGELNRRFQAIYDGMTEGQRKWVVDNYIGDGAARPERFTDGLLAQEYLRMLIQMARREAGDIDAGVTELAATEVSLTSKEARSWFRMILDKLRSLLRVKPDPQLKPMVDGMEKLLRRMEETQAPTKEQILAASNGDAAEASRRQQALNAGLIVGKTFGQGNPDLFQGTAPLVNPIPANMPLELAKGLAHQRLLAMPSKRIVSEEAVTAAGLPAAFIITPGGKESWATYAKHLVESDRSGEGSASKYDGFGMIEATLKKPNFAIKDPKTGYVLYGRAYEKGQIHLVTTAPGEKNRVVTQFMFSNGDNDRRHDYLVVGTRQSWRAAKPREGRKEVARTQDGTTPRPAGSKRLDAPAQRLANPMANIARSPREQTNIQAESLEAAPTQQGVDPTATSAERVEDTQDGETIKGAESAAGARPRTFGQRVATDLPGLGTTAETYEQHADRTKRAEADAFFATNGYEKGADLLLSGESRLADDTQITAALRGIKHFNEEFEKGGANAETARIYAQKLAFDAARRGTEAGQEVQAFKEWSPERAAVDYVRQTTQKQEPLKTNTVAGEIKAAVETARTQTAEQTVVAAEPIFKKVEEVGRKQAAKTAGVTEKAVEDLQGVFDFFETDIRNYNPTSTLPVTEQIREAAAEAISKQAMTAMGLADPKTPPAALSVLEREVRSQAKSQLDAILNPPKVSGKALRPGNQEDIAKIVNAVDKLDLAESVFNTALENLRTQLGDGVLAGAKFDRTKIDGLTQFVRSRGDLRSVARLSLSGRTASLAQLQATIAAEAKGLTPAQATSVAKALEATFNDLVQKNATSQLEALVRRNQAAKKKVTKDMAQRLMENVNLGAFSDPRFYDAIAPGFELPAYDPAIAAEITRQANEIQTMLDDGREGFQTDHAMRRMLSYIAEKNGDIRMEKWMSVFYGNMLSGWTTQVKNVVSTALNGVAEMTTMQAATNPSPFAFARTLAAFAKGAGRGSIEAASILTKGVGGEKIGDKVQPLRPLEVDPFKGPVSKILNNWKYVFRTMQGMDTIFYRGAQEARAQMMAEGYVRNTLNITDPTAAARKVREVLEGGGGDVAVFRREAEQTAKAEGLSGLEYKMRVAELIERARPENIRQETHDFAGLATFNHKPEGLLGELAQAINLVSQKHPAIKLVVPFTNIVSNVLNTALDYTPVGFVRAGLVGSGWDTRNTGEKKVQQIIKAAAGTAAMAALYLLNTGEDDDELGKPKFRIHGMGPADAGQRKQLQATGWIPYSIETPNGYFSYQLSPASVGLAIVGNVLDSERYQKAGEQELGARLAFAVGQAGKVITSQSFLSGAADLVQAVDSTNATTGAKGVENFLSRTVSSALIPNFIKQTEKAFIDPKVYQPEGLAQIMVRDIPFVRSALKPALNILGEPVTRNPFTQFASERTDDPVWDFLATSGLTINTPQKSDLGDRKMTDAEVYELIRYSGQEIRKFLEDEKVRTEFEAMPTPDNLRQDAFDQVVRAFQAAGKAKVREDAARAGTLLSK